jgi:hypothetical protein
MDGWDARRESTFHFRPKKWRWLWYFYLSRGTRDDDAREEISEDEGVGFVKHIFANPTTGPSFTAFVLLYS